MVVPLEAGITMVGKVATLPVSPYAATKRGAELLLSSVAPIYGFRVASLRFFTVYGPWGRPDMALFKFTRGILEGHPIQVFNNGEDLESAIGTMASLRCRSFRSSRRYGSSISG